jgi:hypothetical protein
VKGLAEGSYAVNANVDGANVKRDAVEVRSGTKVEVELRVADTPK